jgi:hypothetical protein
VSWSIVGANGHIECRNWTHRLNSFHHESGQNMKAFPMKPRRYSAEQEQSTVPPDHPAGGSQIWAVEKYTERVQSLGSCLLALPRSIRQLGSILAPSRVGLIFARKCGTNDNWTRCCIVLLRCGMSRDAIWPILSFIYRSLHGISGTNDEWLWTLPVLQADFLVRARSSTDFVRG